MARSVHNASQGVDQLLDHNRLGQKAVHAAIECPLSLLLEHVSRHGNDRDGGARRVLQRTDALGGGAAVHDRHLHIHQHQIIAARVRGADLFHRDRAVLGGIDQKTVLVQDCNRDLAVQLVILDQQDMPSAEVGVFPGQDVLHLRLRMSDGCRAGRTGTSAWSRRPSRPPPSPPLRYPTSRRQSG